MGVTVPALTNTTFNSGQKNEICTNSDCSVSTNYSGISYYATNWWQPPIPSIFTTNGTFIYTNVVMGISDDSGCPTPTAITNAGTFTVVVTNSPPIIISQPITQTFGAGITGTLTVTAVGTLPLVYQWYFNGASLASATNATLSITNIQPANAGLYDVVITNIYGMVTSSNAILTVILPSTNYPAITSFNPSAGVKGAIVDISGLNFSPTMSNNIVRFGAVQAVVSSASATNLVVSVPPGATLGPITETVNGLTADSMSYFLPTFDGNGSGIATTNYGSQLVLPVGAGPMQVVIADLDGDGRPDLLTADSVSGEVSIYQNLSTNGILTTNSFGTHVKLPLGGGSSYNPMAVAAADVEGDGKLDIIALNADNDEVEILRNLSTPGALLTSNSFGAPVIIPVPGNSILRGLAVQDLNGDGKPDLVTVNASDPGIATVFQNESVPGNIAFGAAATLDNSAYLRFITSVAIGDMDGDGTPDLVIGDGDGYFSVGRNIGTPRAQITNSTFGLFADFPALGGGINVALGDMDGDGKLDVTFASQYNSAVALYRNTETPGNISTSLIGPRWMFGLPGAGNALALGDLDGDGRPDVAAADGDNQLSLFRNLSTPGTLTNSSLGTRVDLGAGSVPTSVAIGDLDGDGRPEIVAANYYDSTISIYQNFTPLVTNAPTLDSDYDGRSDNQEIADGTDPFNPGSVRQVELGSWSFVNTNTWVGDQGQLPLIATNVAGVSSWSTNAALVASASPAILSYRDVETNGDANINLRAGTIRFWFMPLWSSTSVGGSGPGTAGRLIEVGNYNPSSPNGWWSLYLNSSGNQISFGTATNGSGMTNFSANISWTTNQWHEVVLAFSTNSSALYLDTQLVTNGAGTLYYPGLSVRTNGFRMGSDATGANQANGAFAELATFNYMADANWVLADFSNVLSTMPLGWEAGNVSGETPWYYTTTSGLSPTNGLLLYTPLK